MRRIQNKLSIEAIRLNVFGLHCIIMAVASFIIILSVSSYTKGGVIYSALVVALINFIASTVGIYYTYKRKIFFHKSIIFTQLTIAFLIHFNSVEQTGSNPIILFFLIVITPLMISLFNIKLGFLYASMIIVLECVRLYLFNNQLFFFAEKINNGLFHYSITAFFIVYSALVFGYYAYTIKRYMHFNFLLNNRLTQAVNLLKDKRDKHEQKIIQLDDSISFELKEVEKYLTTAENSFNSLHKNDAVKLKELVAEIDQSIRNIDIKLTHLGKR